MSTKVLAYGQVLTTDGLIDGIRTLAGELATPVSLEKARKLSDLTTTLLNTLTSKEKNRILFSCWRFSCKKKQVFSVLCGVLSINGLIWEGLIHTGFVDNSSTLLKVMAVSSIALGITGSWLIHFFKEDEVKTLVKSAMAEFFTSYGSLIRAPQPIENEKPIQICYQKLTFCRELGDHNEDARKAMTEMRENEFYVSKMIDKLSPEHQLRRQLQQTAPKRQHSFARGEMASNDEKEPSTQTLIPAKEALSSLEAILGGPPLKYIDLDGVRFTKGA